GAGRAWSTCFVPLSTEIDASTARVRSRDRLAGLELTCEIEALGGGGLRLRHRITNLDPGPYQLDWLEVALPVPDRATVMLDLSGRWGLERVSQRRVIADGLWLRESRGGRPGHDSASVLCAGTDPLRFGRGEAWGVHVAWSGNTRYVLERQPSGLTTIGGGELLLPGEVVLAEGESYTTPWVHAVASDAGLDGLAAIQHADLRARSPRPRRPRPVTYNTWEAVGFDQDPDRLLELADRAADVGAERFVLDDGWFSSRRSDRSGLGDWWVSPQVWPTGLAPLIERVHGHGMQMGLWIEPEMVNPDSELYRRHPDWTLGVVGRPAALRRHQLVLDVGRPQVRRHLVDSLESLLSEHAIDFVKWDHNRELIEPAGPDGSPAAHAYTVGFYALLDALAARFPAVEWESCAAGGGRIDLAVLERVHRVWASDTTDALARQSIQRWTAQLVPPEYVGAHISAERNHQTGRRLDLDFRAGTAFFGDLGVEYDLMAEAEDLDGLAAWISLYKRHRELLHSGRTVRVDTPGSAVWIHGVIAADASEALFAYVQLEDTVADPIAFTTPGLAPEARYLCTRVHPADSGGLGPDVAGRALATIGLAPPARKPETVMLVHLRAVA
ncbi:MAG: alpha-galactosidase, partial [Jatrophihabitantaceae bacterium]